MLWLKTSGRSASIVCTASCSTPRKSGVRISTVAPRHLALERANRRRVVARAAIGDVVAVDRRDDDVLELHLRRDLCEPKRLERIGRRFGFARVHVAVAAGARARVAEDLERRGPSSPALGDVRAPRLLADRVQARAVDQLLHVEVARIGRRRAHLHPLGAARALGDGERLLTTGENSRVWRSLVAGAVLVVPVALTLRLDGPRRTSTRSVSIPHRLTGFRRTSCRPSASARPATFRCCAASAESCPADARISFLPRGGDEGRRIFVQTGWIRWVAFVIAPRRGLRGRGRAVGRARRPLSRRRGPAPAPRLALRPRLARRAVTRDLLGVAIASDRAAAPRSRSPAPDADAVQARPRRVHGHGGGDGAPAAARVRRRPPLVAGRARGGRSSLSRRACVTASGASVAVRSRCSRCRCSPRRSSCSRRAACKNRSTSTTRSRTGR